MEHSLCAFAQAPTEIVILTFVVGGVFQKGFDKPWLSLEDNGVITLKRKMKMNLQ